MLTSHPFVLKCLLLLSPITMPIELYQARLSGPSRAVLLTIKQLGLDVELKDIDLTEDEQLKPEFVKVNLLIFKRKNQVGKSPS